MADIDKHDSEAQPHVPDESVSASDTTEHTSVPKSAQKSVPKSVPKPSEETPYTLPTPQHPNAGFGERITPRLKSRVGRESPVFPHADLHRLL